ncbi:cellulose biosynthesis protein BcsP [Paraburkholderia sp. J94]|uniref:cellulose biosynthesis protein BcsP n=1 Tax=Paraburkholderia sp. J94 TaxID=2805441 RepID=UPI002AAF6B6C|nr:cellulose biosynthesis protein BcsP [Paraburkholderia sp. J94]
MSTSRDVKALFDRFGGDASSYREIRMENEARDARGRWPLLGMIDPREVDLSAAEARPGAPQAPELRVKVPRAQRDDTQAALRQSAPLFTRSPRRDVPPVIRKEKPAAPASSAFRFSPIPAARVDAAAGDAQDVANALTQSVAGTQPNPAPLAFAMPATGDAASAADAGVSSDVNRANAAANEAASADTARALPPLAPRFAQPASVLGASAVPGFARTQAQMQTQSPTPAPAPAIAAKAANLAGTPRALGATSAISTASRPASAVVAPLKKLFGRVAASDNGTRADAPAPEAAPARLDNLFDRLRSGNASHTGNSGKNGGSEAASRRPWFLKGVSGP